MVRYYLIILLVLPFAAESCEGTHLNELLSAKESLSIITASIDTQVVEYNINKLININGPNEKTLPHLRIHEFESVSEQLFFKSNLYTEIFNILRIDKSMNIDTSSKEECKDGMKKIHDELRQIITRSKDIYYRQDQGIDTYHPYFDSIEINAILSYFN